MVYNFNHHVKNCIYLMLLTILGFTFQSCSSDDDYPTVDGQNPTISLANTQIQTEPGRAFVISGVLKDADGLKSVTLKNAGMNLDKTINLLEIYADTLLHEYNLSYNYTAGSEWKETDSYPVEVTVEDVGGRTSTATVNVTPDGDFTYPSFVSAPSSELTVLVQNPKLTLNSTVSDNKSLKYLKIEIPTLNINDSINISGKQYTLNKVYNMPADEASYQMTMTVSDQFGNIVKTSSVITVSELPDFAKMYLADVNDVASLNSDLYGVPMLIDHTGEYQYSAKYYNQKAGTGVRFIPQTTDFDPICFGIDESTGLLTSNPSVAQPIILDKVGYYEITFNTVSGEYDVKQYTPTTEKLVVDGTQDIDFNDGSGSQAFRICLAGTGLPDTPSWTTNPNNNAFLLNQDKTNPYLLYKEMNLKAGDILQYTISAAHIWGWWPEPYWRFDGSELNEVNVKNKGENMNKVTVTTTGTYRIEFDYHLLRSRIIFVK